MRAQSLLLFLLALLAFYLAFGIGPIGKPIERGVPLANILLASAGSLLLGAAVVRLVRKEDRL